MATEMAALILRRKKSRGDIKMDTVADRVRVRIRALGDMCRRI